MEMISTAGMLTAEEAKEWGLVNHVCAQDELIPTCEKIASKIARNSSVAIGYAIKAVNAGLAQRVTKQRLIPLAHVLEQKILKKEHPRLSKKKSRIPRKLNIESIKEISRANRHLWFK